MGDGFMLALLDLPEQATGGAIGLMPLEMFDQPPQRILVGTRGVFWVQCGMPNRRAERVVVASFGSGVMVGQDD
jgi:hypothetical protein